MSDDREDARFLTHFSHSELAPLVLSVICCAGEVGSGTVPASSLQYFSADVPYPRGPGSTKARPNTPIDGVPQNLVECIGITARREDGSSNEDHLDDIERQVEETLAKAIDEKVSCAFSLHATSFLISTSVLGSNCRCAFSAV